MKFRFCRGILDISGQALLKLDLKSWKSYSIETTLHMIPDIVSNEVAQTFASRDAWFKGIVN